MQSMSHLFLARCMYVCTLRMLMEIPGALLLHETCETQLIAEEVLQVRQNTYFCTVYNGDCIVYNQASMNMDLLN